MVSLRGWHIISGGLIWLTCSVLTFCSFMPTLILGIVLLLIAVVTIFIGMVKIFRYERYENQKRNGNTDIPISQVDGQRGYNPFENDNSA
jgi:uncharacterized membrane protein